MSGDLTARDVIARWMCAEETRAHADADDLLAALADAGWRPERDDQWKWGVRDEYGTSTPFLSEQDARRTVSRFDTLTVVRRRPAGEWEVAP